MRTLASNIIFVNLHYLCEMGKYSPLSVGGGRGEGVTTRISKKIKIQLTHIADYILSSQKYVITFTCKIFAHHFETDYSNFISTKHDPSPPQKKKRKSPAGDAASVHKITFLGTLKIFLSDIVSSLSSQRRYSFYCLYHNLRILFNTLH